MNIASHVERPSRGERKRGERREREREEKLKRLRERRERIEDCVKGERELKTERLKP